MKISKADKERMEEILAEVASSTSANGVPGIDEFLDSFEEIQGTPEYLLKPGQLPPHVTISTVGLAVSNRLCADGAKAAALDHSVAPLFPALRVRFSKVTQSLLGIPTAHYIKEQKDMVSVTWSPNGSQMRVDLGMVLAANGWRIPVGYTLRAEVQFVKKHPKIGSAMIIYLKDTGLKKKPKKDKDDENQDAKKTQASKESKTATESKESKDAQQAKESVESKQATEAKANETPATEKAE